MSRAPVLGPSLFSRRLAALASLPYAVVTAARNRLYDAGWLPQSCLPCRVISIGNITVGGTGKTPVVIWTVNRLMSAGFRVGVLSRGYRRQGAAARLLVSDGRRTLADAIEAGDEPFLIASRCPGAIVAVGADRAALGFCVLDRHSIDCFVLDDGFQHRRLHRDLDLVLVDASDGDGLQGLLPLGRLREPLSSLRRASAVLLTRVEKSPEIEPIKTLLREGIGRPVEPIEIAFRVEATVDVVTGAVSELRRAAGTRVVIFSGIGNPASFRHLIDQAGLKVLDEVVFRDHHHYTEADLASIRHRAQQVRADLIVTTEKDAVKIRRFADGAPRIIAVRLDLDILSGRERLERLILGSANEVPSPES